MKLYLLWDMEGVSGLFTRDQAWYWEPGVSPETAEEGRRLLIADVNAASAAGAGGRRGRADRLRHPPRRGQRPPGGAAPGPPHHLPRAQQTAPCRTAPGASCPTWTVGRRLPPAGAPRQGRHPGRVPAPRQLPGLGRLPDQRAERGRDRDRGLLRRALGRAARPRPGRRGGVPRGRGAVPGGGHRARQARRPRRAGHRAGPGGGPPPDRQPEVVEAIERLRAGRQPAPYKPHLPMQVTLRLTTVDEADALERRAGRTAGGRAHGGGGGRAPVRHDVLDARRRTGT